MIGPEDDAAGDASFGAASPPSAYMGIPGGVRRVHVGIEANSTKNPLKTHLEIAD